MRIGVVRETAPGETRVALTPEHVVPLIKAGHTITIQSGAGESAGCPDSAYIAVGATVDADRAAVIADADCLLQVQSHGSTPTTDAADLASLKPGTIIIGLEEPLTALDPLQELADTGATIFAFELVPRITRAQSMDVLSSQANLAGYQAVLMAAHESPKLLPMMMTAAGTIPAAKVLILGAGVAGLQAIATARRLGAVVTAYDVRAAVKEQVESLGATFLEIELDPSEGEGQGGYAKELSAEAIAKQQQMMSDAVAESDIIITTAAIPGRAAPILVTKDMIARMQPGSVIVDMAAPRGGNCEGTDGERSVVPPGVTILGPANLAAHVPQTASRTYSKNMLTFINHIAPEGDAVIDMNDDITAGTLLARDGKIVHPMVCERFGIEVPPKPEPEPVSEEAANDQ